MTKRQSRLNRSPTLIATLGRRSTKRREALYVRLPHALAEALTRECAGPRVWVVSYLLWRGLEVTRAEARATGRPVSIHAMEDDLC